MAFSNAMKQQSYDEAILYAELLSRGGYEIEDSLYYFWGDALLKTGDPEQALEKLSRYVQRAGNSGTYYAQALNLMLEAEAE